MAERTSPSLFLASETIKWYRHVPPYVRCTARTDGTAFCTSTRMLASRGMTPSRRCSLLAGTIEYEKRILAVADGLQLESGPRGFGL